MKKARPVFAITFLLLLGIGAFAANQFISKISSTTRLGFPEHRVINPGVQFEELWAISDLNMPSRSRESNLIASGNQAVLLTLPTEDIETPFTTLIGVDLATGQVKWRIRDKFHGNLAYNSSHIFVGVSYINAGIGYINMVAYDIETGSVVWETPLPSGNIAHVVATESDLYVESIPAYSYQFDSNSGNIIDSRPSTEGSPVFLVSQNIIYWQSLPLYLNATDATNSNGLWQVQFASPYDKLPLFTDEQIFIVTGNGLLYALERSTGEILWQVNDSNGGQVFSNVTTSNGVVYFLTRDAQLHALDLQTGSEIGNLAFQPELVELHNGYTYDVAAEGDIILVHFGDSHQLFAFRFMKSD